MDRALVSHLASLLVLLPSLSAATTVHLVSDDLVGVARGLRSGTPIVVEGLTLDLESPPAALELTRYEVWTPNAKIEVVGPAGSTFVAPPRSVRLLGRVAGQPGSHALVTVRESGEMRGLIFAHGRSWTLSGDGSSGLLAHPTDLDSKHADRSFTCGTDALQVASDLFASQGAESASAPQPLLGLAPVYRVDVAIETDQEYLAQFGGNTTNATDYAADILAYATLAYDSEVGARLAIPYLRLWTTTDPWGQSNPLCALFEFGRHWNNTPPTAVPRAIVHMFSGKSNGGGVAWLGVLCGGGFDYDRGSCSGLSPQVSNYGGPYGYSGDLDGNFNPGSPQTLWDTVVVAHEIGHNFNSPHSHCYAGIGGNANHIDHCYGAQSGCYAGSTSLPSGCPGAGQACGTMMSYCHFLGGGLGNMGQTFGLGHPYGVAPERQAARMRAHVEAVGCLPLAAFFSDGFESGNTSGWSAAVP